MKGFIKVTGINEMEQYLNIDYIIKFGGLNEDYEGNSIIYIKFGEKVSSLQTKSTIDEVVNMIKIAKQ